MAARTCSRQLNLVLAILTNMARHIGQSASLCPAPFLRSERLGPDLHFGVSPELRDSARLSSLRHWIGIRTPRACRAWTRSIGHGGGPNRQQMHSPHGLCTTANGGSVSHSPRISFVVLRDPCCKIYQSDPCCVALSLFGVFFVFQLGRSILSLKGGRCPFQFFRFLPV